MEDLGSIVMRTMLMWPIIGGALAGLIGGLIKRHGAVGTLLDVLLGGALGYGLILALIRLGIMPIGSDPLSMALMFLVPVIGGLIAVALVGRFRR